MKISSKILYFIITIIFLSKPISTLSEDQIDLSSQSRAVWVSPWGGDQSLIEYQNKTDFITKINYILDTIKSYKMNTIIFHVRTHNDALYPSTLNPTSPYFSKVNFSDFDPLGYVINETHKRGIEFHAWMNPYRVKSSIIPLDEIAESYKNFPKNPASNASNMLNGTSTIILNPGLENVKNFIIDTVIEFLNKYKVDAIHFDDYFYCDMGAGGQTSGDVTILNEPDQDTYIKYIDENPDCGFSKNNAENKADWRRLQVNDFIQKLHTKINNFNTENNQYVQLGISPTGIYKNGDGEVSYDKSGNAVTTGSETNGQQHYSSYLFCDTLNWINNEWIEYILPQSYWATDHPVAAYEKVMGWWDKVVKYKKVNLYSGIGLYMSDSSANTYGWKNNDYQFYDQLSYIEKSAYIKGASIYNFDTMRKYIDGKDTKSANQTKNGLTKWNIIVPPSEIKAYGEIKVNKAENLVVEGNKVKFDKVNNAKFYVIYRNEKKVDFSSKEIVDIFSSEDNVVNWEDKEKGDYKYGVKALSYSNNLGEGSSNNKGNYFSKGKIIMIGMFCSLLLL